MLAHPHLSHGKTLPILFCRGYLHALWEVIGNGQLLAARASAANQLVVDAEVRKEWLAPLRPYLDGALGEHQPLDYQLVSLMQYGLVLHFASQLRAIRYFMRMAGRYWWFGEPPISTYSNETGLVNLFGPIIMAQLAPWKWGAPGITQDTVKGSQAQGVLALTTFVGTLQEHSGIACDLETGTAQLQFTVRDCPFCVYAPEHCGIWEGIVGGLLDWLHANWKEKKECFVHLALNTSISMQHHLLIDLR